MICESEFVVIVAIRDQDAAQVGFAQDHDMILSLLNTTSGDIDGEVHHGSAEQRAGHGAGPTMARRILAEGQMRSQFVG